MFKAAHGLGHASINIIVICNARTGRMLLGVCRNCWFTCCRGPFFATSVQAQSIRLCFEGPRQMKPSRSTVTGTKGYGIGPLLKPNTKLAHSIQITHVIMCRGPHQNSLNQGSQIITRMKLSSLLLARRSRH